MLGKMKCPLQVDVMRYVLVVLLGVSFCTSPGEIMKSQHPDFWNEIIGTWEILPEGQTQAVIVEFLADLKLQDSSSFFCGSDATPHYWTGQTPAETVFTAEQPQRGAQQKGTASLQKMEFRRGQFMVVCNGKQMNYIDHIVFYGLSESAAKFGKTPRPLAGAKYAVMKEEDGRIRRFAYRRLQP